MKKYVITDGNWYMVNPRYIPDNPTKAIEFFTREDSLGFEFNSDVKANLFFLTALPQC